MCGIVGYVGPQSAAPLLLEGLHRLEYRGYDSAGVAVLGSRGLRVHKRAGRVGELADGLPKRFGGSPGIGHTRWATHGAPTDENAHPHLDTAGRIAVVHNGIIENAATLRAKLAGQGVALRSETDTEVLAHLIAAAPGDHLEDRVRAALSQVTGTYGIAVLSADHPDVIVVARNGSPIVLGVADKEMYVASDVGALVAYTRQVVHLDDGELAVLRAGSYRTVTLDARETQKAPTEVSWTVEEFERGGFDHYMRKEIAEQPEVVERTLGGRIDDRFATVHLGGLNFDARELRGIRRVKILGCGSAYYAGQVGAQLIEDLARIPADAEPAAEFRYRNPVVEPDALYVALSQSGETYDTLSAVQELKRKGGRVLGIVNVVGSAVARACDGGIYLHAGPEVSVASTKAVTAMQVAQALLALHLGRIRDLSPADGRRLISGLRALPTHISKVFEIEDQLQKVAEELAAASSVMYVGRVRGYPVAREGAQKLKEIAYVHAEAYPAGELKHGPLALIGPDVPTVAIVPDDDLLEKNIGTVSEIAARHGRVIAVTHEGVVVPGADEVISVPRCEPELDSVVLGIALQLLAYHASVARGADVDKPRNLAKSVTVE